MTRRITIVGASMGGLVAAAALRERGFAVTILERGQSVSGLYGKVQTPFGEHELGMHVLYLMDEHYRHLCDMFGADALETWDGYAVDIGGCHNFGRNFFNSIYPDVRALPTAGTILDQVLATRPPVASPASALDAVIGRFGEVAGRQVVAPILAKLWQMEASALSAGAIHCFYDLRRMIVCDKERADDLKQDLWLDGVIGNPQQHRPSGTVFGGRRAARFTGATGDPAPRVRAWLDQQGITVEFGRSVTIDNGRLLVDGVGIDETADGCIVATPVATMAPPAVAAGLDQLDLSIYYLKLARPIGEAFPAYYLLCHEASLQAARIVNYDAYHVAKKADRTPVLAVEAVHPRGTPPADEAIAAEVGRILPTAQIEAAWRLPRSLAVPCPTLANAQALDAVTQGTEAHFDGQNLFYAGMRTDKGVFFSHHTIGLAYDAALALTRQLA